jgi:integrase
MCKDFISNYKSEEYSARTIRYAHSILSMTLNEAVTWNLLIKNPCGFINLPKQEKKEMKAFSKGEAKRFIETAKQNKPGIILEFALTTGMRPEEYLAQQWSDIDFNERTATIQRALVWRKGEGWIFKSPKTRSSRRTIPLPLPLLKKLRRHKIKQAENRLKLGIGYENNNLVFATDLGTPIRYGNLDKRFFRPTLKEAGLASDFRLYYLRHSCATLLLVAGVNVKVVSEGLGHASIKTTSETYAQVLPGMQESATNEMSQMLYG